MKQFCILLTLLYIIINDVGTTDVKKYWNPDTNYGNPENWNLKRVPCYSDVVKFPPYTESAISLNLWESQMKELILPRTGELVFAEDSVLVITGNSKPSTNTAPCPAQELEFTGGEERAWLDSNNWRKEPEINRLEKVDSPIPHAERIPCPTDQVVFPPGNTFKVQLPDIPVQVQSIYIQHESVSSSTFQKMALSNTGYHLFKGDAQNIIVTGNECLERFGCMCIDQSSVAFELLCRIEKRRCKQPLPCESPIQPVGHCCQICGAVLMLEMKIGVSRFSPSAVIEKLKRDYSEYLTHVGRVELTRSQLVLIENGVYSGRSIFAANKLAAELTNDETFGVRSVTVQIAGEPITYLGSTRSIVLYTLFLILLLVCTVFLTTKGFRKYGPGISLPTTIFSRVEIPSFHFRRFENRSVSVDGEVEITSNKSDDVRESQPEAKAFNNPMFGYPESSASTSSATMSGEILARPKVAGQTMTVENPTYRALQAAAQRDLLTEEPEEAKEDVTPDFASSKYTSLHDEEE